MTHFHWIDNLNLGHEDFDNDHRQVIEKNQAFIKQIEDGAGLEALKTMLDYLFQYTREHFRREEDEMLRIGYDSYAEHKKEHDTFIREISLLKDEFDSGAALSPMLFARILHNCLCDHFMNADGKLVAALNKTP